jgi:transposase, IS30 family
MKRKKWKHFSVYERTKIECWLKLKQSVREIARQLKRSPGSVSREINKNKTNRYRPENAHEKALKNRSKRGKRNLLKNEFIKDYVEICLTEENRTPESISLRIEIDTPFSISHEAIYQYIYSKDADKNLRKYLPFRHRQRHRKGYRKVQKLERLNSLPSIELRPKIVDERVEIGHFEDDSIVSRASDDRIKSVNERVTGIVFFNLVPNGTMEVSNRATINSLKKFPPEYLKTLTRDRGTENYGYEIIEKELKMNVYFAHPYCSHERGSNENLNGLFRRYFPKGTDFSKVTVEQILYVEMKINNRPRKRFGGLTPVEVLLMRTGVAITY